MALQAETGNRSEQSMPKIFVTTLEGKQQALHAELNQSVMEVIRDSDIRGIEAICGGSCACATCHVYVTPDFFDRLPLVGEDEQVLLEGTEHYQPGSSRLSCQIRISEPMDGLGLTIAPEG
jgi:ferredoxin, 2Fe-2S